MAAEEDIRTPSRAQPEPPNKTVPPEAKARDELGSYAGRRNADVSPRPGPARQPRPASPTSPTRPDPQSQSLSRSYESNVPISLTYIILSISSLVLE
jgi:hypothetical protein